MPALDISGAGIGLGVPVQRTVAFEQIDGPSEIARKLKAQLAQEVSARKIASVSREQPSQYRVWIYLAAIEEGQKTTITWTWDVSTADHQRVARFTGEVPGAPSERAWAAASDAVVARMAQEGTSRLAAFLAAAEPTPDIASASEAPLAFLPSSRQ
jgi:hypothetical protein